MPSVLCRTIDNPTWNETSCNFEIAGNVHLWRAGISANVGIASTMPVLNMDEISRANQYLREQDKQRFTVSRILLRVLLAKYLHERPEEIRFSITGNKKPCIAGHEAIQYNVTHSGDTILIAVANMPVGVDVEKIDELFSYADILSTCFSNEEMSYIRQHGRKEFYRGWTRKEAILKAAGKGIDNDLQSIPCMDGVHEVPAERTGANENFMITSFDVVGGYVGSIACPVSVKNLVFYDAKDLGLGFS